MGWITYSGTLWEALQAARNVVNATRLDGLYLRELPASADELRSESLPVAAAFLETNHHRERIIEGLIASCVEDGTLLAALHRLRAALADLN